MAEALSNREVLSLTVENSKEANTCLKAKLDQQPLIFLDFFASQSFDKIVFLMAPLATTLIIQASVIADRPLPSFSLFLPPVANTSLPFTIEGYRLRVLIKYPNMDILKSANTDVAWDYCIYKIFASLKIYFSVAMVNDLDSIIYAALINLAIAINWISPWAHKIEGLVASNTDKIKYEKLFGHFMVKADNWPNSLNGVVGERLVTYSST